MEHKQELLRHFIQTYFADQPKITHGLPLTYQQALINYLIEQLLPTFLHIHEPATIKNHLNAVLPVVNTVIFADRSHHEFFKFNVQKKQAIATAIAPKLVDINIENKENLNFIERWNKVFFQLKQGNYLLFLQEMKQLIKEIERQTTAAGLEHRLVMLFQSLALTQQDNQCLDLIEKVLSTEGLLAQKSRDSYLQNLAQIKAAFIKARVLREAPLKLILATMTPVSEESNIEIINAKFFNSPITIEQKNSAKQIFKKQLTDYYVAKDFTEALMRFIKSSKVKKNGPRDNLKDKLKKFCEENSFFGITISNYNSIKAEIVKQIPVPIEGFSAIEWSYFFNKIIEESFKLIVANLNKSFPEKINTSPVSPPPEHIRIGKKPIGAGAINSAYLATVHTVDDSKKYPVVYRIGRQRDERDAAILNAIYAVPHPVIIKRYYSTPYMAPEESVEGIIDYLEYASRGTINSYPLSSAQLPGLFYAIIDGVRYLHELNIAHLDLKPANILLGDDGTPRIIDFDLARYNHNKSSKLDGTYNYWPPEAKTKQPDLTMDLSKLNYLAFDVWALGVTLYELYTGQFPPYDTSGALLDFTDAKHHVFFHQDSNGNFLNTQAKAVAEAVQKLLAFEPLTRLENFKHINTLSYLQAFNKENCYKELTSNPYLYKLKLELKAEMNLARKKFQVDDQVELPLSEKINCYEKIIARHTEKELALTREEEELITEYVDVSYKLDQLKLSAEALADTKQKAVTLQIHKILEYKKIQCEQAIAIFKEEVIKLKEIAALHIIRQKLANSAQYADFICEKMVDVNLTAVADDSLIINWKELKKDFSVIEKKFELKQQHERECLKVGKIIARYNQILAQDNQDATIKKYLTAFNLLNTALAQPEFQSNEILKNLLGRINEEINRLKENPLAAINSQEGNLSPNSFHQKRITISAASIAKQSLGSVIPTWKEWERMTSNRFKFISFIYKQRLASLKIIDNHVKSFATAKDINEKINKALVLIIVCQQWLINKNNGSKRETVLRLQTAAIAELQRLLKSAFSLKAELDTAPLAIPLNADVASSIDSVKENIAANRYFGGLFTAMTAFKDKLFACGGINPKKAQHRATP